jgi:hypothetical protein
MPRGPAPKPDDKRQRRNEPTFASTELDRDAKVDAPALPNRSKFGARTKEWYDVWARSPQAAQFLGTDWQRLQMLAFVVDDFFKAADAAARQKLLAEIRSQEAKLGGTPEDRLRLRWRMAEGKDADERARKKAEKAKPARRTDPRLKLVEGGAS